MVGGVILLIVLAASLVDREAYSRVALHNFDQNEPSVNRRPAPQVFITPAESEPTDFKFWSQERIRAYYERFCLTRCTPLAVLRLDRLNLRAPVFEGTDDLTLNRGVGWIAGTTRPGKAGNIGIAGHRDSFFRGLKDISLGDAVELSTPRVKAVYIVDQVEVVQPDNVSVLRPRRVPSITLTTCYPFYMVGPAPKRFIVHAALKQQIEVGSLSMVPPKARAN